MINAPRHLLVALFLVFATPLHAADNAPIERGTAILDPSALRALDQGRLGLEAILAPTGSAVTPLTNRDLFALPSMAPVRKALDEEFARYVADHKAGRPADTIGVGESYDHQLFDRALFDAPDARFILSGIVNRMDRAYVDAAHCGEIRLLYRMARIGAARIGELDASPRLPMTLNVVLKAKGDHAVDAGGAPVDCAEVAKRWLAAGELTLTGDELAAKLMAKDGPLDLIAPENIDRIETNLQIAHVAKSAAPNSAPTI